MDRQNKDFDKLHILSLEFLTEDFLVQILVKTNNESFTKYHHRQPSNFQLAQEGI